MFKKILLLSLFFIILSFNNSFALTPQEQQQIINQQRIIQQQQEQQRQQEINQQQIDETERIRKTRSGIVGGSEDEEDFVLETEYTWNELDTVSVIIKKENIKLKLKADLADYEI